MGTKRQEKQFWFVQTRIFFRKSFETRMSKNNSERVKVEKKNNSEEQSEQCWLQ